MAVAKWAIMPLRDEVPPRKLQIGLVTPKSRKSSFVVWDYIEWRMWARSDSPRRFAAALLNFGIAPAIVNSPLLMTTVKTLARKTISAWRQPGWETASIFRDLFRKHAHGRRSLLVRQHRRAPKGKRPYFFPTNKPKQSVATCFLPECAARDSFYGHPRLWPVTNPKARPCVSNDSKLLLDPYC